MKLVYDEKSPSGLSYENGKHAGTLHRSGYWRVSLNKKQVSANRVVWEMFHGTIPDKMQIDHINRDRGDNRIENLRCVTRTQNMYNTAQHKDSKSGIKGLSFDPKGNRWFAKIVANKKPYLFISKDKQACCDWLETNRSLLQKI